MQTEADGTAEGATDDEARFPLERPAAAAAATGSRPGAAAAPLSGSVAQADRRRRRRQTHRLPDLEPAERARLAGGTPQSASSASRSRTRCRSRWRTRTAARSPALAGIEVTFAAPGSGPSGTFAGSGSSAALVGTNAAGSATASQFTANTLAGGYTVVASSDFGSVSFSLVEHRERRSRLDRPALVGGPIGRRLDPLRTAAAGARCSTPTATRCRAPRELLARPGRRPAARRRARERAARARASPAARARQARSPTAPGSPPRRRSPPTAPPASSTAAATTAGIGEAASFQLHNLAGKPPVLSGPREGASLRRPPAPGTAVRSR